ncbi:MAG: cyclic nucleotide-binding domain-containing protein, partial [Planctomycetes bacterium]|nr:cyclic nucleotide-binding domain-containing protein [Planctomycetota bacterium]
MSAATDNSDYLFGRIALAKKFVTAEQLKECLGLQARLAASGKKFKIGDVLLARKCLAPEQVQKILAIQAGLATANLQRQYPAGEVIFWEDDPADRDLYMLRRGVIDITKNDVLLETCEDAGTFFGISGFILKAPHATTAIARTDCEVLRLSESGAAAFFKAHPGMLAKLSAIMAQSLRRLRQAATAPGAKVSLPLPPVPPPPAVASA